MWSGHLELNNHLLGGDALLVRIQTLLHRLETLADNHGLGNGQKLTLLESGRNVALPNRVSERLQMAGSSASCFDMSNREEDKYLR
jgi:hypothetical protein